MKRLWLLLVLAACSDLTAPTASASIVFKIEASCQSPLLYNLLIDGKTVAETTLAARDSVTFVVPAGQHTAGAVVAEGLVLTIWYPQTVTLAPSQRYVQTLRCN